jgi:hypothetical protein
MEFGTNGMAVFHFARVLALAAPLQATGIDIFIPEVFEH